MAGHDGPLDLDCGFGGCSEEEKLHATGNELSLQSPSLQKRFESCPHRAGREPGRTGKAGCWPGERHPAGSEVGTCSALEPHSGEQRHGGGFMVESTTGSKSRGWFGRGAGYVLAQSPRVCLQDVYWGRNRVVEEPGNVQTKHLPRAEGVWVSPGGSKPAPCHRGRVPVSNPMRKRQTHPNCRTRYCFY